MWRLWHRASQKGRLQPLRCSSSPAMAGRFLSPFVRSKEQTIPQRLTCLPNLMEAPRQTCVSVSRAILISAHCSHLHVASVREGRAQLTELVGGSSQTEQSSWCAWRQHEHTTCLAAESSCGRSRGADPREAGVWTEIRVFFPLAEI